MTEQPAGAPSRTLTAMELHDVARVALADALAEVEHERAEARAERALEFATKVVRVARVLNAIALALLFVAGAVYLVFDRSES